MLRRFITLLAGALLASSVAVVGGAPAANAAVVDLGFGPLSIGDYCHANVSASAWIGFYKPDGLKCYATPQQYVGSGSPYLACKYLTTDVVMAALRDPYDGLICRVVR